MHGRSFQINKSYRVNTNQRQTRTPNFSKDVSSSRLINPNKLTKANTRELSTGQRELKNYFQRQQTAASKPTTREFCTGFQRELQYYLHERQFVSKERKSFKSSYEILDHLKSQEPIDIKSLFTQKNPDRPPREPKPYIPGYLVLAYTCKPCGNRNVVPVSKQAYYQGVAIATCKHCEKRHVIADNFEWFGPERNIEELLAKKGESTNHASATTIEQLKQILFSEASDVQVLAEKDNKADAELETNESISPNAPLPISALNNSNSS